MRTRFKILLAVMAILIMLFATALSVWYVSNHNIAVLDPKGIIAKEQRQLMLNATLLMAIVVLPVFVLTFVIAWRYRATNKKATYSPSLRGNKIAEAVWWLIPLAIIIILAVMAASSSHSLDPYRPIASDRAPLKVQVIALQWKWLFLYPEQQVASVNSLPLPTQRPIEFTITSDAPMNSFWIPQLGGQVYAMAGMSTKLHLQASQPGQYHGSSANISGEGFSGMTFTAHAMPQEDFDAWAASVRGSHENIMNLSTYRKLREPTKNVEPANYFFPSSYSGLYDTVVMKYTSPQSDGGNN